VLVVTATLFFALTLPAQRYYGRDHHVYHPPAQAKHQASSSANSHAHATATSTANSTGHSAAGAQSGTVHGPGSTSKPDAVTPPNPGERQPQ